MGDDPLSTKQVLRGIRVALNEEQFRKLVGGEEIAIENPPTGPEVRIILSDIGKAVIWDAVDDMDLSRRDRDEKIAKIKQQRAKAADNVA